MHSTYGRWHIFRNNMDEESLPVADKLGQLLVEDDTEVRKKDGGRINSAVPHKFHLCFKPLFKQPAKTLIGNQSVRQTLALKQTWTTHFYYQATQLLIKMRMMMIY